MSRFRNWRSSKKKQIYYMEVRSITENYYCLLYLCYCWFTTVHSVAYVSVSFEINIEILDFFFWFDNNKLTSSSFFIGADKKCHNQVAWQISRIMTWPAFKQYVLVFKINGKFVVLTFVNSPDTWFASCFYHSILYFRLIGVFRRLLLANHWYPLTPF